MIIITRRVMPGSVIWICISKPLRPLESIEAFSSRHVSSVPGWWPVSNCMPLPVC